MPDDRRDLVIIGAGPTGLSAAIAARTRGLSVTLLEREARAGGAPRHCGHLGFGMLDLARLWTGPRYAAALRGAATGIDLRCGHAVTALHPGGRVVVSGPDGPYDLHGRRILLATGIRETPRAAQLVSGSRRSMRSRRAIIRRQRRLTGAAASGWPGCCRISHVAM